VGDWQGETALIDTRSARYLSGHISLAERASSLHSAASASAFGYKSVLQYKAGQSPPKRCAHWAASMAALAASMPATNTMNHRGNTRQAQSDQMDSL